MCTNLTSVTIPSTVTCIGEAAFWECHGLKDVYLEGTEEKDMYYYSFEDIAKDATLHVHPSLVDTYKAQECWPDWFAHIVGYDATGVNGISADTAKTYSIYSADGKELPAMQKGINILRTKDGKSLKVLK